MSRRIQKYFSLCAKKHVHVRAFFPKIALTWKCFSLCFSKEKSCNFDPQILMSFQRGFSG